MREKAFSTGDQMTGSGKRKAAAPRRGWKFLRFAGFLSEKRMQQAALLGLLFGLAAGLCGAGCGGRTQPGGIPPEPPVRQTGESYRVNGQWYHPVPDASGFSQAGIASWYGSPFHGRKTASGESYNMHARTAAHKTLPIGTFVLVRRPDNGKETVVRINDRGPFVRGRIIDLSCRAARDIGMIGPGTARVEIVALEKGAQESEAGQASHAQFYTGNFTVQVGAFLDRGRAEKLCRKLRAEYSRISVTPVKRGEATFYRVQVGRYTSLASAEAAERRLVQTGYAGAFAVARDKDAK
jgi:rare lipoprotein A